MLKKCLPSIVLSVLGCFGGGAGLAQEASYEFKLKKPADTLVVTNEKDRTVFTITSESGIGGADITLRKGTWPKHVTARFSYTKDRGFSKLEGFTLTTAHLQISHSVPGAGEHRMPFWLAGPDGKFEQMKPAAGALNVTAANRSGALELDFPAHLCVGSREIKLTWIDAFRN